MAAYHLLGLLKVILVGEIFLLSVNLLVQIILTIAV